VRRKVGSIERRLQWLEERTKGGEGGDEEAIRQEAFARVTDEDLKLVRDYLKRAIEEGGDPTEEEAAAILRYEELREEVRDELRAPSQ